MFAPTDERHVSNIFNLEQHVFTRVDMADTVEKTTIFRGKTSGTAVGLSIL